MKAISVLQPWASLIVQGHKKLETRTRPTKHRGPLLIHASANNSQQYREIAKGRHFFVPLHEAGYRFYGEYTLRGKRERDNMPRGAIIGIVNVVDTVKTDDLIVADTTTLTLPGRELDSLRLMRITTQERAFGDYSEGRYAYLLSDPVQFKESVPARGQLGLWTPDEATSLLITQQIQLCNIKSK